MTVVLTVLGIFIAVIQCVLAWFSYRSYKYDKQEANQREQARLEEEARRRAEADQRARDIHDENLRRQEEADRRQADEDLSFALEILKEATTREILVEQATRPLSDIDRRHLQAVYDRLVMRRQSLEDSGRLEPGNDTLVGGALNEAMSSLEAVLPSQDIEQAAAHYRALSNQVKYSWQGHGRYSSWLACDLIAMEFARQRDLTTVADFTAQFHEELLRAMASEATYAGLRLGDPLVSVADQEWAKRRAAMLGRTLVLDGQPYLLSWTLGFAGSDALGPGLHARVIEYFAAKGYPVKALAGRGRERDAEALAERIRARKGHVRPRR